jgi:tRNA A37 threonylcarbamoyladenosine biosynthesis protein TsaE
MGSFPPKCYYFNQSDFGSVDEYKRNVVIHHPDLYGYLGQADIKFYGLKKQNMSWEREIKVDIEWKRDKSRFQLLEDSDH